MAGINKSIGIGNKSRSTSLKDTVCYKSTSRFDVCGIVISLSVLTADLVTDAVLLVDYFRQFQHFTIYFLTFYIGILIIFQILSINWFLPKSLDKIQWMSHCCLFGITYRYITLLQSYLKIINAKTQISLVDLNQNKYEVYKLHLLYIFAKSMPQTIINSLILINRKIWIMSSGISLILTSLSVFWLLIQYFRSRLIAKDKLACGVKTKYALELFWTVSMLISRIFLFLLISVCFGCWVLLLVGLHWMFCTSWIFKRSKTSGFTAIVYNCLVGGSNCFVLIDFDDNLSLINICAYYINNFVEIICGISLCFFLNTTAPNSLKVTLTVLIISSTLLSSIIIFLYHKYYYKINGKIKFKKKIVIDNENVENGLTKINNEPKSSESASKDLSVDADVTDRKLLLENLVARSGTPTFISTPILDENTSNDVLFYSILNSTNDNETVKEINKDESIDNLKNKLKRRGICSESDLGLQSADNDETNLFPEVFDLMVSKRRGICSSVELEKYDNILSRSKVTFDNNDFTCETESKSSDDSKYTLILSAPSEIMSAHDYENVCAVNIAREFWGLRSWRGYSDIETWLHDDSIVRDQDNITSTIATSTSSEISSNDAFENVLEHMNFVRDNKEGLFSAKPYIIDQNGSLLPLGSLSPIKEEVEESPEKNESGSSLVSTIDVIRKNIDINSPRYVYHRTESVLESPTSDKPAYKPRSLWSSDEETLPVKITKPIYENNSIVRKKLIAKSKILMKLCDNELTNCDNFTNIMYLDKPIISSSLQSLVSSSSSEDILSISEIARCFPLVRKPTGRPRRKFSLIRDRFEMRLHFNNVSDSLNTKENHMNSSNKCQISNRFL